MFALSPGNIGKIAVPRSVCGVAGFSMSVASAGLSRLTLCEHRPSQAEMLCSDQKVLHGRRMPSCTATGRLFVHCFELSGDLMECMIRAGRRNTPDQAYQPIIILRRPSSI